MSNIVEEIREAYARAGIQLDQPATYGTSYRLVFIQWGLKSVDNAEIRRV